GGREFRVRNRDVAARLSQGAVAGLEEPEDGAQGDQGKKNSLRAPTHLSPLRAVDEQPLHGRESKGAGFFPVLRRRGRIRRGGGEVDSRPTSAECSPTNLWSARSQA